MTGRSRRAGLAGLWLLLGLVAGPLRADKVKIEVDGVKRDLERNIRSLLSLGQEDDDKLDEARIRRLHAKAPAEIGEALQPFGYYKPQVRSTLEREGERWVARYEVDEGPAIQIASVDLSIDGEGGNDPEFRAIADEFPVRRGTTLFHPDYEQGKKALVDRAAESGYLDAKFETSEVRVDLERYRADVVVHFQTGPRYRFGDVRFDPRPAELLDDDRAAVLKVDAVDPGARTTFTYTIELRMLVPGWVDRTVTTSTVSISDQFDNLTRRHSLSRVVDGRTDETLVTDDDAVVQQWLTTLTRLPIIRTARLDPARDYYVRISAQARPRGGSILGWASSIVGQAKFTLIP